VQWLTPLRERRQHATIEERRGNVQNILTSTLDCMIGRCVRLGAVVVALGISTVGAAGQAISSSLNAIEVRAALIPRINDGTFRGLATAWRDGDSLRTAAAGVVRSGGAAIDQTTLFELGELDALLTSALLANLVVRGELSLDDPAQRFLPLNIRLPLRGGRAITLGDLAFHRAGLPAQRRMAGATLTERVAAAVRGVTLSRTIRYQFSELGTDILGLALSRHLGMSIETAILSRILAPVDVSDLMLDADRVSTSGRVVAVGHALTGTAVAASGRRREVWRGSIVGLTRFAAAAADTVRGPLAPTFALMMRTRSIGPDVTVPVALGWRVLRLENRDIYWHDALNALGFSAFVAVDTEKSRAAAALSNSARPVESIAGQLLLGAVPQIDAAPARRP
jgi:serine-type D-Ala-D-Ala carboxypeptidase/endopeptidase